MNASIQCSMLLFFLFCSLTDFGIKLVLSESSYAQNKEFVPEDVGRLHTEAFQRLMEKMAKRRPQSVNDIMKEVGFIAASYCENQDDSCRSEAMNTVWHHFEKRPFATGTSTPPVYPDHLDPLVEAHVNSITDIIQMINGDNLDEIIQQIESIRSDWIMIGPPTGSNSDNNKAHGWVGGMDELSHKVGLISVSVALESSKLWHSALFPNNSIENNSYDNDKEKAYHPFQEWILDNYDDLRTQRLDGGRRSLEQGLGSILSDIIIPDVLAAIEPVLNNMDSLSDLSSILTVAIPSIAASASSAFGGSMENGDDYYVADGGGSILDIFDILGNDDGIDFPINIFDFFGY